MKIVDAKICSTIKTLSGNVLGIGLNEKMLDLLNKNDNVTICNVLSAPAKEEGHGKKAKVFNMRKMRKKFGHKKVDTIVGNLQELDRYMKRFVADSIYITKGDIYLYSEVSYDESILKKRYERFNITFSIIEKNIYQIHVGKAKNNKIKEKLYYIIDTIIEWIDIIGDILAN